MNNSQPKYDFLKNKICPYCQSKIKTGADFIVCSKCGVPHHKECWDENLGCTTYGCGNNPLTETKLSINSPEFEDVGNQTISSIRESLNKHDEEKLIKCGNCKSEIEEGSVYCKHCGFNVKENKFNDENSSEKKEFEKEFKKRYREKVGLTRKRFYITLGSFLIIAAAIVFLFYTSITKLNEYFASDEYKIKNTVENWKDSWEKEDIEKFKSYLTDDYEYYGKDGKKVDLKERIKRIEWSFKNYKDIEIGITEFKIINDTSTTDNDRKIQFRQTYKSDKFTEKGMKTLRMYRGEVTNNEWKIYREFFEEK